MYFNHGEKSIFLPPYSPKFKFLNINELNKKAPHFLQSFDNLTNIFYFSVSNNAATNDFAENGRKSSIFSPTPIKRIGT